MQTISRLYANEESARKAWDELKRMGYADSHIFTPASSTGGSPAGADDVLEKMVKAYVVRSEAVIYAERVSRGASLVTVHAPFSGGHLATSVLHQHSPIDSGVPEPVPSVMLWDEAAPLSSALQWPVLAKTEHPFETITGIPSLICSNYSSNVAVRPDDPAPLSDTLGLPLLSDDPTPLSSLLNLPVLMKSEPLFYK
jgi:hypothetical protein